MTGRRRAIAFSAVAFVLASAAAAFAAPGSLTFVGVAQDGAGFEGLANARFVSVSPDGRNLYVAGPSDDAVAVLRRDPVSGSLSFVEQQKDGVGAVDGLVGVSGVAVSPEGNSVYAVSEDDDALVAFARDPATGSLTFLEQEKDGVGGVDGLAGGIEAEVSADGRHVYATAYQDGAVAAFARNPATGALSFIEAELNGIGGVSGLDGAFDLELSPDDRHVYIASQQDSSVVALARDDATGALTFVEEITDGDGGAQLGGALGVDLSPDGAHLYIGANGDSTVNAFARDAATGKLALVEVETDGAGGVDGLGGADAVAVSPDGGQVYVTGYDDDAVVTFARDPATGALSFVEEDRSGVGGVSGVSGSEGIDAACDGGHVYPGSQNEDAVAIFSREGGLPGDCAPDLALSGKRKQRLGKKVKVNASCGSEICELQASAKLKGAGNGRKLKPAAGALDFGEQETLKLKISRKTRRAANAALDEGGKLIAKLTVEASDLAANVATATRKVKLKG